MADPQVQNALSRENDGMAKLRRLVFELKETRVDLEVHGVTKMTDEQFAAAITDENGRKGDLSHMTVQKVKTLLAAMDALDAVLLAPTDLAGVTTTPLAAISAVIR